MQEVEDGHEVACHLIDEPERREEVDPTKSTGFGNEAEDIDADLPAEEIEAEA
jgi:hypothetical protein